MKKKASKSNEKDTKIKASQKPPNSKEQPHFKVSTGSRTASAKYLKAGLLTQHSTLVTQERHFATRQDLQGLSCKEHFERNCAIIGDYLKWLKDHGLKLPENPKQLGKVFFTQVEVEARLKTNSLNIKDGRTERGYRAQLNRIIQLAASRLGMEVRVLPQSPIHTHVPITYEQLWERGTDERKHELKGKPNARQQMYNTRTALNHFLNSLALEKTSSVGRELVADFRVCVERVMRQIRNKNTKKKFQTGIHWWHDFYQHLIKEQAIPSEFNGAVAYLIARSGLSLTVVAKPVGVAHITLKNWAEGIDTPSKLSHPAISQMELLFKLPTGTLLNKITSNGFVSRFRISQLPFFLQQNLPLARRVIPHLPDDFCELHPEKQKDIVLSIDRDVVRGGDSYAKKLMELHKLPYYLKAWPKELEDEFNDLVAFKTADRPPLGMKRNEMWRSSTAEKTHRDIALFFGALCLPVDSKDNVFLYCL